MEYVQLMGAEEVSRAASTMREAAQEMSRAAGNIQAAMHEQRVWMDEWLARFEAAMKPEG